MQHETQTEPFGIAEARRVLGDVFAPWVQDLNLSIERSTMSRRRGRSGWQPGAMLRLPFSERLCRNGGTVCGQALMAFADTSMVIANLAANRGYRPMTTVDQTTHFMRAVTASRRAGGRAGGPDRAHHELWPRHAVKRRRQQAGRDGVERLRDAVNAQEYRARLSCFPVFVESTVCFSRGLVVRDARRRAPHDEGQTPHQNSRPHPEEHREAMRLEG